MLNPTFSKAMQREVVEPYVAPPIIANRTVRGNADFDTGPDYRRQEVYSEENWLKLERAGLTPELFNGSDVMEVCAGTGFLTYHLLQRSQPKHLTVNDISSAELNTAREFIGKTHPDAAIEWVLGDMHTVDFGRRFDVIIGNSFIHHFHDVEKVLARFLDMLKPGGIFISLHEPTPMSTVVEGGKIAVWPLAVLVPGFVNDIARYRYKGQPSDTDLWMFESHKIKRVARQAGFSDAVTIPWGIVRPIVVQRHALHLSKGKPTLSVDEERRFRRAFKIDAILNLLLPQRCFGSLCLVCRR